MDLVSWLQARDDDIAVAAALNVSPRRVAGWRRGERFPRPRQLLALKRLSGGLIDFDASVERAAGERVA